MKGNLTITATILEYPDPNNWDDFITLLTTFKNCGYIEEHFNEENLNKMEDKKLISCIKIICPEEVDLIKTFQHCSLELLNRGRRELSRHIEKYLKLKFMYDFSKKELIKIILKKQLDLLKNWN